MQLRSQCDLSGVTPAPLSEKSDLTRETGKGMLDSMPVCVASLLHNPPIFGRGRLPAGWRCWTNLKRSNVICANQRRSEQRHFHAALHGLPEAPSSWSRLTDCASHVCTPLHTISPAVLHGADKGGERFTRQPLSRRWATAYGTTSVSVDRHAAHPPRGHLGSWPTATAHEPRRCAKNRRSFSECRTS
jgi:hypothetical protein